MNYKRALVTGGAGLIGFHIADRLATERYQEIVVLDNFSRGRRQNLEAVTASGKVTCVQGDIRDAKLVREVMEGIEIVFHEALEVHRILRSGGRLYFTINDRADVKVFEGGGLAENRARYVERVRPDNWSGWLKLLKSHAGYQRFARGDAKMVTMGRSTHHM